MITAAGVVVAGWYFLVKRSRGYHVQNLSLSLTCERVHSKNEAFDWVASALPEAIKTAG